MQNRLKIALVVAVFFGLIAAYGIFNFLRQQRQAAEALRTQTQDVVIAAKDIPAGSTIAEAMLKDGTVRAIKWPKASVPGRRVWNSQRGDRKGQSSKNYGQ